MKPIMKLLFVVLLIAAALSLPASLRAGGSWQYSCNYSGFNRCVGELEQWLQQCTYDCSEYNDSGMDQFCETTTTYIGGPIYDPNQSVDLSEDTTCFYVPMTAGTCVKNCVNSFNNQYQDSCIDTYCTPN